ncbi:UTP--glucose-1-phosphate uridylyltransferase [Stieleria sp. TO1_6]|uniref:UTP--glucose-1-phosphate uridylyltransferase n=1 Tax=Stieleria tagensis TaxID=2956795 RepID=UPI00209B3234|nr:UTP--glucose-1-phosphate uridylyltransferase [Stieleria tagensis]MCO8124347.1 UTP--glucose-1-phosphate uridylyltransferase [Stieleria tagensis]
MNMTNNWPSVLAKLQEAGTPEIVINLFKRHYENLCSGQDAFLRESTIQPATDVVDAETLSDVNRELGREYLQSVAVLKLNGGLGTGMGLEGPKSLLPVRGDDTFLAFILRQSSKLSVPLVLMNSFSTETQTAEAIKALGQDDVQVISFLQHQVPKIDAQTMAPAEWPADPQLQWCPPGHGDIYAALVTSGTLKKLLAQGKRYLFVSNADNLGATMDLAILGHFIGSGKSFLMEVADRTAADRKGGHLARSKSGGLVLREKAQCHPDEEQEFQDVSRYRYFNTNNLWLDLVAISEFLDANDGVLSLPTITNRKTVDPKDSSSPAVFQLETAMGAAIEALPNTDAIRVPRSRFAPVKTTGDLLAVRSDAYEVRSDASVGLVAERNGVPPNVKLDDRYFKKIADLEQRVEAVPSLRHCDSLTITGNVNLSPGIICTGDVTLTGPDSNTPTQIPPGNYQ